MQNIKQYFNRLYGEKALLMFSLLIYQQPFSLLPFRFRNPFPFLLQVLQSFSCLVLRSKPKFDDNNLQIIKLFQLIVL